MLRKPFEASVVIGTIRSLVQEAKLARGLFAEALAVAPAVPVSDAPQRRAGLRRFLPIRNAIQAAITLALDAALAQPGA